MSKENNLYLRRLVASAEGSSLKLIHDSGVSKDNKIRRFLGLKLRNPRVVRSLTGADGAKINKDRK